MDASKFSIVAFQWKKNSNNTFDMQGIDVLRFNSEEAIKDAWWLWLTKSDKQLDTYYTQIRVVAELPDKSLSEIWRAPS